VGNAKIAFGADLDDAMLDKLLGIIKINASFSVVEGNFKLDRLLISAAVSYLVPAKTGSWQAAQGLNEIEIAGFAKLNYPCQSIMDPFTNQPRSLPLLYGEVSAKMAMGSESDPVIIGSASGSRKAIVQYHCHGGQKLMVYLEVHKLKLESSTLIDIKINLTLSENIGTGSNKWNVAGSMEGAIDMNSGSSDKANKVSMSGATAVFIFDTSAPRPFFDVAVKLEFGPFDSFYMSLMVRVTRGRCSRQGNYVKGVIRASGDDWKLAGSLFGNRLCVLPDNPDAVRYNLSLAIDEIVFADGLLNISNAKVEAIARGPYRGEDDHDLTILDWTISVKAELAYSIDTDDFSLALNAVGEFILESDAINPAESNSTETSLIGKPGAIEIVKTRMEAIVDVSYGQPGDHFAMNLTAHSRFSWPCISFLSLVGSLDIVMGDGAVDLSKMSAGFTVHCHDPDAYAANSVYAIEIFTDHTKAENSEPNREFDDYAVSDAIGATEAAEEAAFAPPAFKEASCDHGAQYGIVMDSFWGAAKVRTVHSKFAAETELRKALDHLKAMEDVEGYQLCSARIKLVKEDLKQNMIERMSMMGELNHTEYSALRNNPRQAWEFIASLDEPQPFAGGQFEISNVLLSVKAYDRAEGRAPAMQKQDLFPDMSLKYYRLQGDFTATASVDIERDSTAVSSKAMRTSSAALGGFSLEATTAVEARLSLVNNQFDFNYNLTVNMEIFVNSSQFYLHMRGEYNKPCNRAGVDAFGMMRVVVPSAIEIEDAIITGTLYCEGADPRVEAYLGIESLVLADILEIEQVHVNLRSGTPAGAGNSLEALDWKVSISGTIRFDKMLSKMPSLSSKGTVIGVDAKLSVTGGEVTLDQIIVHFTFDITYQGSRPADNPMLHVFGAADFGYPCGTGDSITANLTIDLNVGTIDWPGLSTEFVYYCGDRHFTRTIWELDAVMLEPFNVQDMFVLTSARLHVNAYRYITGGWWHTIEISGATDPDKFNLHFYVDAFISTKNGADDEMLEHRGFGMEADLNVTYTSKAFSIEAKARVVMSDSCESMRLSGMLMIPSGATSNANSRDRAMVNDAEIGEESSTAAAEALRIRAEIEIPCATVWVDRSAADPTDALSGESIKDSTMKVQQFIVVAKIDTWIVGPVSVTDAALTLDASVRSDGAYLAALNVSGKATFDTTGDDSMGPSGLGGSGVTVNVHADLAFAQTTFCFACQLPLLSVVVDVDIKVRQSAFKMDGTFSYHLPCTLGEFIVGQANLTVAAGDMVLPLQAVIKYSCGNIPEESPRMTFAFFASRGQETAITDAITIKDLTVRAAVYVSTASSGSAEWNVSGSIEGIVKVDTAEARLGLRERTWSHMLRTERRAQPELGVAKHRVFPSDPYVRRAHLSSEHDQPAHLGLVLSTSFFFDTRPDPPLFKATVALEDIVLGCMTISLKASASTCTAASPAFSVMGTLKFNNCDGLRGTGNVIGKKWCDDGGAHPLYSFMIEAKSLQVGELIVSDVWMSAVAMKTLSHDGSLAWAFKITASMDYTSTQGVKMPSLGVKAKLKVRAVASVAPADGFTLNELKLSGILGYSNENVKVSGAFSYHHPCQPGEFANATILFDMKLSTVNIEGAEGNAKVFCDPPEGFPTLSLFIGVELLQIGSLSVSDVEMNVDMFSKVTIVEPKREDSEDTAAVSNERFFKGSVSGKASVEGVEASVFFSFDTDAKTFHVMVKVTVTVDPIELLLTVGLSGENGCNALNGNFVRGEVKVRLTPESIIRGSVRGAKHCESHPKAMHALERIPPLTSPKYDEIAEFLYPGRLKDSRQTQLEMLFPMMTMHGLIESRTPLAPGLYLETATMSLYKYVVNGSECWTFEVTGAVSFESMNPTFARKRPGRSGGLAAELYFAFAAVITEAEGLHNVKLGVTASIDASFGASPQIALKGRLAFANPCLNVKGELTLSLSELGEGFDSQANIELNATVGCRADDTPHSSVMSFAGRLVGSLKTDMVDVARLEIVGSLHNNAASDGVYFFGKISGAVSAVTAVGGLNISAELDVNSSVPLFVLNVKMSYTSTVVDVELRGSTQLPLERCKSGDAFSLDGTIVAHLGSTAGDLVARAHGSKKCEANATAIYGYTYHISFDIETTTIQMGFNLTLDKVKADFYAKVIGSDTRGGEGMMSWFGLLHATISTQIPGLSALSQFEFYVSAAFVVKDSTMALGLVFGFSYESETVTFDAVGRAALLDETGDGLELKSVAADGTFSLRMGSDINVTLDAHFSLRRTPDTDGRDLSVFLTSGEETITVGGVDLGTFSISVNRYQAIDEKKEGWKGLLTSDSDVLDTVIGFDTRDGSFAIQASVTLELGPVTLTLEAGHDCSGERGEIRVGATAVLTKFPKAKLMGEYRNYCGHHEHGLEWSVDANAKAWAFGAGISLRDVSATMEMRKAGGLLVRIMATVDFSAGTASPMPLPSLTAEITIDDGHMEMQVLGDLVVPLGDNVVVSGNVSFVYPCALGKPTTVHLGIEINSDEFKLQDAFVLGKWYCVETGIKPPADAKLSEYAATIGIMQVGGFALRDVNFSMYNTHGEQKFKGLFKGTVQIIPELSVTVSVPFGKRDTRVYEVGVNATINVDDVKIEIQGAGIIKSPCQELGDLYINVTLKVTNIPVEWMPEMSGSGTFESNCGDEYIVSIAIDVNKVPKMQVGTGGPSPEIPSGSDVTFSVHIKGDETTFQLGYTIELDSSGDSLMSVFLDVLVHTGSVNIGIILENIDFGSVFRSVGRSVPGSGIEETSPVKGASTSAQGMATGALGIALGEVMDTDMVASLGGFSNMINGLRIGKVMALFSTLPDDSISLTISLYGIKLFGLSMELFVHAVSEGGAWKCLVYIGLMDIGGYVDFAPPWGFLSAVLNIGMFLLGGGLDKLGFTYATDDMMVHPHVMQYSPIKTNIVRRGFGIFTAQDLDGGGFGVGSLFKLFNKLMAGDCNKIKSKFQQLICDDLEALDDSSYPTMLPVDGTIAFGHSYASHRGVLMSKETDTNKVLWKMFTLQVEIHITTFGLGLMAELVAEITFDPKKNIVSELKVRISVNIDTTMLELELALAIKLKGASQIWAK
jgi:hypothetical protein